MANEFRDRFKSASVEELVAAFNREVGNSGWVTARGFYLAALRDALLDSGIDCSSISSGYGLRLDRKIRVCGTAFVPVDDAPAAVDESRDESVPAAEDRSERATSYFRKIGPDEWFVIGSGAAFGDGIPTNAKVERILKRLRAAGIEVTERSMGFPGSCDSFTFTADFEGGHLAIATGNYFGRRGGTVTGAKALKYLVELLGLKLTGRTAREWGIANRSSNVAHQKADKRKVSQCWSRH